MAVRSRFMLRNRRRGTFAQRQGKLCRLRGQYAELTRMGMIVAVLGGDDDVAAAIRDLRADVDTRIRNGGGAIDPCEFDAVVDMVKLLRAHHRAVPA